MLLVKNQSLLLFPVVNALARALSLLVHRLLATEAEADTHTADTTTLDAVKLKRQKFEKRYKTATTSNEDVLAAQQANWTSEVYAHFRTPEIITKGTEVSYKFVCKVHPMTFVTRGRHDDTSNLRRHVLSCAPPTAASGESIKAYASGTKYNRATHRMNIALWVSRRHRPFAIVADTELLTIFSDLNKAVETPSPSTVSRDVKEIFKWSQKSVAKLLQNYAGRLHICVDGWTAPQVISFLGITTSFIRDGKIESIILDFVKASKSHTGIYLASRISDCLREYGIQDKILAIVGDNASNNDTMINELADLIPSFPGNKTRVRCFAHILNLVVKAILSQFSRTKKVTENETLATEQGTVDEDAEDEESVDLDDLLADGSDEEADFVGEEDDDEIDPAVQASDDAALQAALSEIETDIDLRDRVPLLAVKDANLGWYSILKLRTLAKKIFHSPTLRADLEKACQTCKVRPVLMVRDVATRWNSTAMLLKRALELKEPLKTLVGMEVHNRPRSARLGRYKLSKQSWELLEALEPLLDVFLVATEEVSRSRVPLIHEVIRLFDIITVALDDYMDDVKQPLAVRAAAVRGMAMLNKYYSLTDDSIVYHIALILHPRHKTTYFSKAGWPRDWIQMAENLAREEWERNYKPKSSVAAAASSSKAQDKTTARNKYFARLQDDPAMDIDPFDDWLSSAIVVTSSDPITYWTGQDQSGHPLARMALDFLSIPATSTDVERSFSRGGLTVSKMRHSLSDESTRAATVLGSWVDVTGAIPRSEIVENIKKKASRLKTVEASTNTIVVDDSDDD